MSETLPLVFVVDDEACVRGALERLLRSEGFRVRSFDAAEPFLATVLPDAPACLLVDLQMPGLNGLDLQQAMAERDPHLPVIFVTGHGDIPTSVRAMKAGAMDFLTKPFDETSLLDSVRAAVRRHEEGRDQDREAARARERVARLTPREREVLALVVRGRLNKQVAQTLGIAEKTVKIHRARLMEKLETRSVADLVRLTERAGLAPTPPEPPP